MSLRALHYGLLFSLAGLSAKRQGHGEASSTFLGSVLRVNREVGAETMNLVTS